MLGYEIDWDATGSWMQAWAGFANAAVILWAAYFGSTKFKDWLLQRQTERKIEAAERLLSIVYRAPDVFTSIRSPMSSGGEVEAVTATLVASYSGFEGLEGGKKSRLKTAQTALSRMAHHADFWDEVSNSLPTARTYFGQEMEAQLRKILQQRQNIWASTQVYPDVTYASDKKLYYQCESDFWWGVGKANGAVDRIGDALKEVVAASEELLLPLLKPPVGKTGRTATAPKVQ